MQQQQPLKRELAEGIVLSSSQMEIREVTLKLSAVIKCEAYAAAPFQNALVNSTERTVVLGGKPRRDFPVSGADIILARR